MVESGVSIGTVRSKPDVTLGSKWMTVSWMSVYGCI